MNGFAKRGKLEQYIYIHIYLLEGSVDGCDPLLHVSALHRFHEMLQVLQQLRVSLKVVVVKFNPVS